MEGQYDDRRPVEIPGLAVDAHTIWLPDLGFERRFITRVDAGSPPAPAVLLGAFLRTPGWVVRPEKPLLGLEPLVFAQGGSPVSELIFLGAAFGQGGWAWVVSGAGGEYRRLGGALWMETPRGVLLLNKGLEPVGYSTSGRLGLEQAPDIWRGREIAAGPLLDFEAFDRAREDLVRRAAPWALTVRGFFRHEEEAEGRMGRRFRFRGHGDEERGRNDFLATGYTVGPKRVLVSHGLSRDTAMRLERLVVFVEGEERPARFLGAYRDYHAFLLETEGNPLPEPMDLSSSAGFSISEPLIALTADHETGRRRDLVELNRVADLERGYRGILEPVLQRFPRPATLFLGAEDHAFRGAVLEVNREGDEDELHRSFRARGGIDLRLLTAAELRQLLEKGEGAFDTRLTPRPAEREKDMVWLGVDFQPMSRELARSQGVEVPTRGGEIGLIVLRVEAGSPAERAGLAPGDVLLSLREEAEPESFELKSGGEFGREEAFDEAMDMEEVPDDAPMALVAGMGPPWRSPRNFLNEKLTRIGEGKKVELIYLRGAKQESTWIPLEAAPPDFENARKFKSEELGLTVKDLTYEVRGHYRLKPDSPGVVVARVEPGGRAAVSKVLPFEILVSLNGKVVHDVEEFRRLLEGAGPPAERSLELKLERMGKSRLVRIRH